MASISLFCLTFLLILSCSITLGTVDIFQSQDRSVCHGMNATVTCVTVISGGLLRWVINGQQVFSVSSGQTTSFTQTVNGNEFVFVRGSQLSGVNIYTYTSTVSLNTNQAISLSCSDGILQRTLGIGLVVEDQPSDSSTVNNKDDLDSVIMSWTPPADAGICCVQYRVVSSNGTSLNTTEMSFTLSGITTHEERNSASISVCCMDQVGTMGPLVTYRPNIDLEPPTVSDPVHVESGDMPMYEINLNLPNSSEGAVSSVKSCTVTVMVNGSGTVIQPNCDVQQGKASFTISDLSSFRVLITFDYGLGFGSTTLPSPINGSYYNTTTLMEITDLRNNNTDLRDNNTALRNNNTALQNQTTALQNQTTALQNLTSFLQNQTTTLQNDNTALQLQVLIVCVALGGFLLFAIILIIILVIYFAVKSKVKASNKPQGKNEEIKPQKNEEIKLRDNSSL